jgi:thioredoxin reductase
VLVIDQGKPRNAFADAMHAYLTRDGINPLRFLEMARRELRPYGVKIRKGEVISAVHRRDHFDVRTHRGATLQCRKLLLATGVRDQLPRVEGIADFYGTSVHHCPYCDGWEWRDCALAALGAGKQGVGLALALKGWSDDVVVLTDGDRTGLSRLRDAIKRFNIRVHSQKIARLQGTRGRLRRIIFEDGTSIARDALFFNTGQRQKSALAEQLGCEFNHKGGVIVDKRERTCVPGVFLAGDASKDVQFVIKAAAEGAVAAIAINRELQEERDRTL